MTSKDNPVIIGALRTSMGGLLGSLSSLTAPELGATVLRALLQRYEIGEDEVDEVIFGNVITAGEGQNPARQAALKSGIPPKAGGMTVNKVCGSSLKAVILASQAIQLGDAELILAGGMESMSNAPFLIPWARQGQRLGDGQLIDSMIHDGLWCAFEDFHMGSAAELIAREYGISREEQDEYALLSHRRAVQAAREGAFTSEIAPVDLPEKERPIDVDELPRADASLEALAKLRPAFEKEGTVTAGNASGIADGAAAVIVASRKKANQLGVSSVATIQAYATSGVEPKYVMLAPIGAVHTIYQKTGWTESDVDLFELNEAFAVQSVALLRQLEIEVDRVNVRGGAIALGHPIGASGARILTTLLHALRDRGGGRGIASLCLGGGNAVALAVEVAA